jgi:glycosyltransferase involved in cell wall biosynthesis
MINLEFVCDLESAAGYAAHARSMVKAFHLHGLEEQGIKLRVVSRRKEESVVLFNDSDREMYETYLNRNIGDIDVRVFFEPAHFIAPTPGIKTVAFVQWETTRIRDYAVNGDESSNWVKVLNKCDLVMTGSPFAMYAFKDSGVSIPVRVITGPVFPCEESLGELNVGGLVKSEKSGNFLDVSSRPVVIGYMAQWTPRKNVEAFIRDVSIAFNGNKNVVGLLKTYSSSKFNDDSQVIKAAKVVRDSCRLSSPPDIFLITEKLTDIEVQKFFNTIDIYFCPSRGEGFNVPAAMAAAAGVPVIAGEYGGHIEFLGNNYLLPGSFSPCLGMSTYDSNQFWYNIDEKAAIDELKKLASLKQRAKAGDTSSFEQWSLRSTEVKERVMRKAGSEIFVENFVTHVRTLCEETAMV